MNDETLTARARDTDPETSHAAAENAVSSEQIKKILESLKDGQKTSKEISIFTGIEFCSVSPRMKVLEECNLVRRTGETKPNPGSKRQAILWRLWRQGDTIYEREENDYDRPDEAT